MQFIWGLLTVISFLCVIAAGLNVIARHVDRNEANKIKQELILPQAKTPEIKQEETPESKPVIEAPQVEEQKDQSDDKAEKSGDVDNK